MLRITTINGRNASEHRSKRVYGQNVVKNWCICSMLTTIEKIVESEWHEEVQIVSSTTMYR